MRLPCALGLALVLPAVIALAAGEEQRPRPALGSPDASVPFDPVYFELAASTGGDFYFWTPGELARTTLRPLFGTEEIVIAHGELGVRREIAIPVDGGLARLDVFSGVQAKAAIELRDPSGAPAVDGRSGVALQRTRLMLLASVRDPAPGTWTLSLSGSGLFSTSARGAVQREGEPVELLGFELLEQRGRRGHEGLFARREPPDPGGVSNCRLRLDGAAGEVVVDFLHGDGSEMGLAAEAGELEAGELEAGELGDGELGDGELGDGELGDGELGDGELGDGELGDGGTDDGELLLSCPVPTRPYRVRVRGRDSGGWSFQRVEAALRDPMREAPPQR